MSRWESGRVCVVCGERATVCFQGIATHGGGGVRAEFYTFACDFLDHQKMAKELEDRAMVTIKPMAQEFVEAPPCQ
jgi:hypothetical protein